MRRRRGCVGGPHAPGRLPENIVPVSARSARSARSASSSFGKCTNL